jgi:Kae1-associated kinase Bud32
LENKCVEADSNLHRQVLDFCRHVAGSTQITAVSLFDYCSTEATRPKGAMEAVLIIRDFSPRLMSYVKVIAGRTIVVVAVDQWIFERDVERGFLGEASAGALVFPYAALIGERYLHAQEVVLKKRLILELLENLALSFPELSERLHIKPEYFMYEVLLNRVRVFPPIAQCVSNFMRDAECRKKPNPTLDGYIEALSELEKEMKVKVAAEYIMIPKKLISESKKPKVWLINISRNAPRPLFTPIFKVFPQLLNLFSQKIETFPKLQRFGQWRKSLEATRSFVDPQKYVFVPTAKGLVSLADRVDIEAFVRGKMLNGKSARIELEPVGGVLNDVYLIKAESNGEEKRVLVKRFKDWSGFKWFPLNLWSLGTRTFAVLGRSRLERECAISELLRNEGFNVPKILHVSHSERLVFMDYLKGENLTNAIKRIATSESSGTACKDLETLTRVGEILAKVHFLNVALGDTKPENVIVDPSGKIYLLDFEQASHGGDKAWDIAEFLYYSGHYLQSLRGNGKAESIAKAFISGYLKAGGNVNVVKKAGAPKYTRVFSLFTALSVLFAMAATCRKTEAVR